MKLRWVAIGLLFSFVLTLMSCNDDGDIVNSVDIGPDGRLYVLNQGDNTLYVYDTKTLTRIDSVDTHVELPHYIEFSPDGQYFYITTLVRASLGEIAKFRVDSTKFVAKAFVPPGIQPSAIAITADSRYGYICNFGSPDALTRIHKIDLNDLSDAGSVQAGAFTHDLKITSDGSTVVACNRHTENVTLVYPDADTVAFIDIDPDTAYGIVPNPKYGPFGVAISPNDSIAYIACQTGLQVRMLDIANRTIVDSISLPIDSTGPIWGPTLMAVRPDNQAVFLTTRFGASVVAFNPITKDTLALFEFETTSPFGITISDDGSRVYVACVGGTRDHGRIYVIDAINMVKVDSIDVGNQSFGLKWQPSQR